ncbi:MAG: hypothetical protein CMP64_00360 [Flavobacteriales bacterium]|nr:hypothetical protein [Flavobacteriales bacterium]|tara:strand:- start:8 stop:1045 length:1038 start_codon:yes stop_codon:yes gene_type:complete
MKHTIYIGFFFLCSCANVIAPNGGPKDINAPKLLEIFPKNNTLSFNQPNIVFVFNENIELNDDNNILISPYSKKTPKIDVKKNELKLEFEEKLLSNTTYFLSLNDLIKDVNEGNILNELNYMFSTGDKIDSLTISGTVIDAKSSEPLSSVWIGLYKSNNDSVLYKEDPIYIVKSCKNGKFSFSNLSNESFYIYAIDDLDNNLKFSIPYEKVGFYNEKVLSQTKDIEIRLFDETAIADSVKQISIDSLTNSFGKLIIDSLPKTPTIIELIKDKNIVYRKSGINILYIDSLKAGIYSLRFIDDKNENGIWDSGNLINRIPAEKVILYPNEITIRENWDIVVEWQSNL